MALYRKKPIVVEISEPWWHMGDDPDVIEFSETSSKDGSPCEKCGHNPFEHGKIQTLEGWHIVCPGDRIITGIAGERYPIKPDIFEATYEAVLE